MKRTLQLVSCTAAVALAWAPPTDARVTRIVIDSVAPITGQPYEQLTGRAFGELSPRHPLNREITDLKQAPHNSRGHAEYIASFRIRKPLDLATASGVIWHDVPNRGGDVGFPADSFAAGDMQLLSGWQGDNTGGTRVPDGADCVPGTGCAAPAFANHYVKTPVLVGTTGMIVGRIINRPNVSSDPTTSNPTNQPLNVMGNPIPYFPANSADNTGATLKVHLKETINGVITEGETIPNSDWKFCYGAGATFASPGSPTSLPVRICLNGAVRTFDPTKLYQLAYKVKDPYVLGAGTAAFRDVQSFFRYESKDDFNNPNPLYGYVRKAIIRGVSQSGNFTRHYLFLGMNEDEAGRIVHDGAWPLIAGRRVANNSRWGQPDGVLELYQMGSEGPQWWKKWPDPVRHLPTRGILDRCQESRTCPKIVETFGGAEVFALKMTMSWVGTAADQDIPLPDNVRRYYLPSSTHGGGNGTTTEAPGGLGAVSCPGNNWGKGTLRANPVPSTGLVNRIRVALRDWVLNSTQPPPSQWPTLAPIKPQKERHDWDDDDEDDDGHHGGDHDRDHDNGHHQHFKPLLVEPNMKDMGFPHGIPGIPDSIFAPESFIFPVFDYDWGPDYDESEANGVPTVQRDAPLGTYLGWNITAGPSDLAAYDGRPFHAGQVCNYIGGMVPFFKTKAQRLAAGDPRQSLEERYKTHDGYVAAVTGAANNAYAKGYLLAADRDALIQQAVTSDVCNQPGDGGKCNPAAP